jgi:hypothetical protein
MRSARPSLTDSAARAVLMAIAIAGGLTACSTTGSSSLGVTRQASQTRVRADSANCPSRVVYVVSSYEAAVGIYDPARLHSGPCGSITGFQSAQGLFVDSKANVWVADAYAQAVYEFAPGAAAPLTTLSDPNGVPSAVAVDEKNGTVYVTEYQNNVNSTTLVEVYAGGSTTPTASLGDSVARNGGYDALDDQGNLYVTFMTQSNTAQVDRWMGGTGTPTNLGLKLISAGGILTTRSGALAVCDPFAFRCGIFERGSTRMSHVFAHMGRGAGAGIVPDKPPFLHPNALALDRAERRATVAADSLSVWAYPGPANRPNHLPRIEIKVAGGAGSGVAVSPASRPGAPF